MRIVILDGYAANPGDLSWDEMKQLGECVIYDRTAPTEVLERSQGAEILLTNKTILDEHTLALAKNLKYIGLFATGYNNIDIEYCKRHNIAVCNAGSYSTNAVAQHTFALILEHFNNTSNYNKFVHDGLWKRSKTFSPFVYPLTELAGKTLGIVGFGNIGRAVARIANAFEMRVLAYNRSEKSDENAEYKQKVNDVEREQENLRELYGEDAEKSEDFIELEKIKREFKEQIDNNTDELRQENAIVRGIKIERLKSHDMVDAKKQGDAIISAANKEIIGMIAQQAKESFDERTEETKEETDKIKEEKEKLEEQIEAAKAEKSKNKQKKDDLDEMYEIGSSLDDIKKNENSDNIPDIKKSLTQIVNELKLTAEDLKGAVVDDNA